MRSAPFYALLLAVVAASAFAQTDFSQVEITTQKLSSTAHMLTGAGGNIGLSVGDDAVFLIDDQYAPLTPKIQAAIAKLTDKPVRFVLNTHWHGDHTGGNENLGKAGAIIVAHENVRKRLASGGVVEFFKMTTPSAPKVALPMVTFTQDVSFHINGDELAAYHVPRAHTDGDSIVYLKTSDVVHMGDTFFNRMYPFIDGGSGGTVDGMIAAADRVLSLAGDNTKIIPGHGPLATKADLQAYRAMLATVSGRIKTQIALGANLEDVVQGKPTAEFDAVWGNGFIKPDRFVTLLYGILSRK